MKHDPKKVFIKTKDGYLELHNMKNLAASRSDPSYQNQAVPVFTRDADGGFGKGLYGVL